MVAVAFGVVWYIQDRSAFSVCFHVVVHCCYFIVHLVLLKSNLFSFILIHAEFAFIWLVGYKVVG
jgi:hypothetical protein